jgi:hypothetical protein
MSLPDKAGSHPASERILCYKGRDFGLGRNPVLSYLDKITGLEIAFYLLWRAVETIDSLQGEWSAS